MRVLHFIDYHFRDYPTNSYIARQNQMLMDSHLLSAMVVHYVDRDSTWEGIPVYKLHNRYRDSLADRILWLYNGIQNRLPVRKEHEPYIEYWFHKLINRLEIDLILCQRTTLAVKFYRMLTTANCPVLIHDHGISEPETMPDSPETKLYREQVKRLASQFQIMTNSKFRRSLLAEYVGLPESEIEFKHYGVEVPNTYRVHKKKDEMIVLFVGRLTGVKGPDFTIQAFEVACDKGLKAKLIIAGDGKLMAQCQQLREQSRFQDKIYLLGSVNSEQRDQLCREADLFTHHARYAPEDKAPIESFGVAIVEAMAASLPVVTCRLGGIAETVIDGETGIFFESENIEAQADALITLANDHELRTEMGKAGWERARDHFSLEMEHNKLIQIIESVTKS